MYVSSVSYRQSVNDAEAKWYKFDDGEVMDCRMDDDEVSGSHSNRHRNF